MYKKYFVLTLIIFVFSGYLYGQDIFCPASLGRGGSSIIYSDMWAGVNNPASLVNYNTPSVSVGYQLPYGINEMSTKLLTANKPFKFGVLSTFVSQYGFDLYNESRFNIAYSRQLTPTLNASVQFNFQRNYISQSGSGQQIFSGASIYYTPIKSLSLAFVVVNPENSKVEISGEETEIISRMSAGVKWNPSSFFNISVQYDAPRYLDNTIHLGIEYIIRKMVFVRTGVYGKPYVYTLGAGVKYNRFMLDAAVMIDDVLGVSSAFGISYSFSKK